MKIKFELIDEGKTLKISTVALKYFSPLIKACLVEITATGTFSPIQAHSPGQTWVAHCDWSVELFPVLVAKVRSLGGDVWIA